MRFIPVDKMQKLREAAHNGDERARKILHSQMHDEDFGADLDEYFKPAPAPAPAPDEAEAPAETTVSGVGEKDDVRLKKFLEDNGITEDSPEYEDAVKEFKAEMGIKEPEQADENDPRAQFDEIIKKLVKEEIKAIDDYSKAITEIMDLPEFNEIQMRRAIARFKEIRSDEEEHVKELNALFKNEEDTEL